MSKSISNFTFGNSSKLMASALLDVAETVTQPYCTFLRERTEISKNGNVGKFTIEVYLNGAGTAEEDALDDYISTNKYPHKDSLYPAPDGKVFKLWGYLSHKKETPFIMVDINNPNLRLLVSDKFVKKFFTKEASATGTTAKRKKKKS